jgi:hypothetical protein
MPVLKTKNIERTKAKNKLHGAILFVQHQGKYQPIGVWNSNKKTVDFKYTFQSDVSQIDGDLVCVGNWIAKRRPK